MSFDACDVYTFARTSMHILTTMHVIDSLTLRARSRYERDKQSCKRKMKLHHAQMPGAHVTR